MPVRIPPTARMGDQPGSSWIKSFLRKRLREWFESQKEIKIEFHDMEICKHRLDLIIEDQIILELKAVKELLNIHMAQLRSYLKATGLKTGLLINFSKPKIEVKRIVN